MKKASFYLRLICLAILKHKSRMTVALLSIIIVSTVSSGLLAVYIDSPNQLNKEFRRYGANLIFFSNKDSVPLTPKSYQNVRSAINSGQLIGLSSYKYKTTKLGENPVTFVGTTLSQVKKTYPYWYITGSYPTNRSSVLVGQEVAKRFNLRLGGIYSITGASDSDGNYSVEVKISGIIQTGGIEEGLIYGDISILTKIFPSEPITYDIFEASISANSTSLKLIGEKARKLNDGQIVFELSKKIAASENRVTKKLTSLIFYVTSIILIITMICVATTTISMISERRNEIGLKKSLGANNQAIFLEFLGETFLLGIIGGIIGLIFGNIFSRIVGLQVFGRIVNFPIYLIPITLIVCVLINGLACMIPVKRALNVDPAIVLKGE